MKKTLFPKYIYIIFITLLLGFSSCVPVKQAMHENSDNYGNRRKHNINKRDNSSFDAYNSNGGGYDASRLTNEEIYKRSKVFLNSMNDRLCNYCLSWVGTPHAIGGTTKKGVDCSGFVQNVYKDVYNIMLPRRSGDMEKVVSLIDRGRLKEGDLLFFGKSNVNHIGIYLKNNMFIHASTSKGVIVSSLEEKYWSQNYRSCGHHQGVKKK